MFDLKYFTVKGRCENASRRTVLMLLHGVGSNAHNMMPLAEEADPRLEIISLQAPHQIGSDSFAWFHVHFAPTGPVIDANEVERSRQNLLNFIQRYRGEHRIDDIYLLGFSQGAIMATIAALSEPHLIRGAVGFSGRFPREFRSRIASSSDLASTAFWIGHGIEDRTLPIRHGRALREVLTEFGASFVYREFAAEHCVTPEMLKSAQEWIRRGIDQNEKSRKADECLLEVES